MSELSNPLFDNERDFLERQKEEYKRALMGDVDHIKSQSQEIGKKVAMAGGVLLAGYLLKRMLSGSGKKKAKKQSNKKDSSKTEARAYDSAGIPVMTEHESSGYSFSAKPVQEGKKGKSKSRKESGSFLDSSLVKVVGSQAATLLLMYITKKVSDHLNSISENNDIAAAPVEEVTVVETTEIIVPKEDAF
ncbi:hypothetical protein [Pontibacter sp. H249]|uniref:hypothetical protein n=1 Tax=Pontibacter sp. H249 TaxID=3133420 RepID=UPI0030BBD288